MPRANDIPLRPGPLRPATVARWRRHIASRWPLVAPLLRCHVLRRLAEHRDDPLAVPLLAHAARSPRPAVARKARALLEAVSGAPAVDALCELALADPGGLEAKLARTRGFLPSDHERACLFLFVTGQLERYFEEDFEFQNLRLEYDRAPPELRARILRVLRSGDRRCLGFFSSRKRLADCSHTEIELALRSFHKHRDLPQLFRAFLELPLRYGLRILHDLGRTDWEPDDPEHRSLYRKVLADAQGALAPPVAEPTPLGDLLEAQLERGAGPRLAQKPTAALLRELARATPLDGVALVAQLARRASPGSDVARSVEAHPHWLVRLAGHRTGLVVDLANDAIDDPVRWVELLAPRHPLLCLPPTRSTPALLEALAAAPGERLEGPLARARKVLQTLLAHRMTAGNFEEMVVELDPTDGEFELADDDDDDDAELDVVLAPLERQPRDEPTGVPAPRE